MKGTFIDTMDVNNNDDVLSGTDEQPQEKAPKIRRSTVIFIIIAAVYLLVCAAVYIGKDIRERDSYVKVTPIETRASPDEWTEAEKININTATADELCRISGIGEVTATKIIEYRENNNGFSSVDDLLNVSGIGEKTLKKIKPYLKV